MMKKPRFFIFFAILVAAASVYGQKVPSMRDGIQIDNYMFQEGVQINMYSIRPILEKHPECQPEIAQAGAYAKNSLVWAVVGIVGVGTAAGFSMAGTLLPYAETAYQAEQNLEAAKGYLTITIVAAVGSCLGYFLAMDNVKKMWAKQRLAIDKYNAKLKLDSAKTGLFQDESGSLGLALCLAY